VTNLHTAICEKYTARFAVENPNFVWNLWRGGWLPVKVVCEHRGETEKSVSKGRKRRSECPREHR
jgi:hypothetical protein